MCTACPMQGPPWGPSQGSEGLGERQARSLVGAGCPRGCRFFRSAGHSFTKVGAMPREGKCKRPGAA